MLNWDNSRLESAVSGDQLRRACTVSSPTIDYHPFAHQKSASPNFSFRRKISYRIIGAIEVADDRVLSATWGATFELCTVILRYCECGSPFTRAPMVHYRIRRRSRIKWHIIRVACSRIYLYYNFFLLSSNAKIDQTPNNLWSEKVL